MFLKTENTTPNLTSISSQAFVHFSTAFCHPEQKVLEEKLYPSPANPHDVMRAMEWMDDETIRLLTPKYVVLFHRNFDFEILTCFEN